MPGLLLVVKQGYQAGDEEGVEDTNGGQFPSEVRFVSSFLCHRYI